VQNNPNNHDRGVAAAVAFLRAINVGGHTVKMDLLKGFFSELGFTQITTFIASGNVIFDTEWNDFNVLEVQIEDHLKSSLGYNVTTFLRSPAEIQASAIYQPSPSINMRTAVDEFHVHQRVVYWLCRIRSSKSAFFGSVFEKTLRVPATFRNMTTVKKVAALVSAFSH